MIILKVISLSTWERASALVPRKQNTGKSGKFWMNKTWWFQKMTHAEKHHRKHNYHHMETARASNDTQPFAPRCYRACITWFLLRPSWRSSANRCACNRKSFPRRTHWALFTQTPSKHLRQDIWLWEAFSMLFFPELAISLGSAINA